MDNENPQGTFFGNAQQSVIMQLETDNGTVDVMDIIDGSSVSIVESRKSRLDAIHKYNYC